MQQVGISSPGLFCPYLGDGTFQWQEYLGSIRLPQVCCLEIVATFIAEGKIGRE